MTVFGDYDPEDSWDATDPVALQLANLLARVHWWQDHATPRDLGGRLDRLEHDLAFVRARVLAKDLD